MIWLLPKEISGEISGFNQEILIYSLKSCVFIFSNIETCIQF